MNKLIIKSNDKGKMLWEYLLTLFPDKTKSNIKKSINDGDVKVNSKKVKDNYILCNNDEIKIFFRTKKNNTSYLKCNIECDVFYEDENIIVFNKKKGILCQEDKNEKINTLNNYIKKYGLLKGYNDFEVNNFSLIHRLDQNTSGLIIGTKNKSVTRILNEEMKNGNIIKKYIAIVHGKPPKEEMVLNDFILKETKSNKMIVSRNNVEYSKPIETKIKLKYSINEISILEVEIHSGKKHQIRAHLAFHGMPIVGDYKYYGKNYESKIKSQILISNEIIFNLKEELSYLNKLEFRLYNLDDKNQINNLLQKYKLI